MPTSCVVGIDPAPRPQPLQRRLGRGAELPVWFGGLLVLGLWLLARPYVGLRHDGILYMGQALLQLHPAVLSKDIFFAFGSQDSYSIVSTMLAAAYSRWGVDIVQIVVPAVCQLGLAGAAWQLLRPLPALERWLGLLALAVLSHVYGGYGIFSFGERFLTGRTVAEPLALLALAALVSGRRLTAALLVVAAAAVHPLVALPALVVGWLLLCAGNRRWGWAALAALVPLALGLAQTGPFAGLFVRYDSLWWDAVKISNGQVLPSIWRLVDWQIVALDLAAVCGAARLFPKPVSQFAISLGLATVGLVALSIVGSDGLHNVLLTQLQLWRVLWLTHVFALLCLPALVLFVYRRGVHGHLAALAMCVVVVAVNGLWEFGWAFMIWATAALALLRWQPKLSASVRLFALAVSWLVLLGLSAAVMIRNAEGLKPLRELDLPTLLLLAATMPTSAFAAAGAVFWMWRRGSMMTGLATGIVIVAATYGAANWDRRGPWTRYIETSLAREHPFARFVPPAAQVYWHDNLSATWLVLKRASYFSPAQGSGLLFGRGTAVVYTQRRNDFAPMRLQADLCRLMAGLNGDQHEAADCLPTEELLQTLCRIPAGPDFLIFESAITSGAVARWTFSRADGATIEQTYSLYDCIRLR